MTRDKIFLTREGYRVARRILKSPRQFVKSAATNGARVQHDKVPLKPLKNASPHSKSNKLFAQAREALKQEKQLLAEKRKRAKFAKFAKVDDEKSGKTLSGKRDKQGKLIGKAKYRTSDEFADKSDERKEHDWNQMWQMFVDEKSKQGVSAGPDFQPHWTGKMLLQSNPYNLRKQFFSQCWKTRYQMECQRGLNDYKKLFYFNKEVNLDTCLRHLFYGHETWDKPLFHTVTTTNANGELVEQKVEIPRLKTKTKSRISILDCGGGQGRALAQILKGLKQSNLNYVREKIGKFVGIGLHVWTKLGSRLKRHHEQMEWYVTDALKAAAYLDANSFDVIIDSFGAYHYSGAKSEILSAYLRLLRPGAAAFVLIGGRLETLIEPMADDKGKSSKVKPQYFEEYLEKKWPKIFTVGTSKTGSARWLLIRKPKSYADHIPNIIFPVKSFVWKNIVRVGKNGKPTSQVVKPTEIILGGLPTGNYNYPTLIDVDKNVIKPWYWTSKV